jgi:hypothetical protein
VPERKSHFSKNLAQNQKIFFEKNFQRRETSLISWLASQYSELSFQITNCKRTFPVTYLAAAIKKSSGR